MPGSVEVMRLLFGQAAQAKRFQQFLQDACVQVIEVRPRQRAGSDPVHRRRITGPPGIGKFPPVDADAPGAGQQLALADDR